MRIETLPLFPGLHAHLLKLLRSLAPEDWGRPTACPAWEVRDIAAHLLDGDLRKLGLVRDGYQVPPDGPIEGEAELVAYLNRLNADWVRAARRLSPGVLIDLLAFTGPRVTDALAALDPEASAIHAVNWAGERASANWFDIGREYTERWHHQQQIRDAVGAAALDGREWLHPVLALFLRALPHAYRDVAAQDGETLGIEILGGAGGSWNLVRDRVGWRLSEGAGAGPGTSIGISQSDAWRLFTRGLDPGEAEARAEVRGDRRLGAPFFTALAVMAQPRPI